MDRLTCKEALKAKYAVTGKKNGITQYAPYLSFYEALRFYNKLQGLGHQVTARVVK